MAAGECMFPRGALSLHPQDHKSCSSARDLLPACKGAEGRRIPVGVGERHRALMLPAIPPGIFAEPKESPVRTERCKEVPSITASPENGKDHLESQEAIQGNEFPTQFLFLEKEIPTCRDRVPSSHACMPPMCLHRLLSHPSSILTWRPAFTVDQPFVGSQAP